MSFKKIAICFLVIVVYSVICLNMHALASSNTTVGNFSNLTLTPNNSNNVTSSNTIEIVNGTANQNTVATNSANNATSNEQLANTGLEELPWLVIAILGVSAVYAYNKVREYKQY